MRHCERSEAIFLIWRQSPGDCRVAPLEELESVDLFRFVMPA
jgi:hypothetical protein